MIEKLLDHPMYTDDGQGIAGFIRPSTSEIVDKLNEIIDVVNSFEVTPNNDFIPGDTIIQQDENWRKVQEALKQWEYDRGYEKCRADVVDGLKSLLRCRNYPGCAAGKGCNGVCSIDSDICKSCENFGIPYSLLAEWQKGNDNE